MAIATEALAQAAPQTVTKPGDALPDMASGVSGYVRDYLTTLQELIDDVSVDDIARVVDELVRVYEAGGRLVLCGNGGSASTASHLVCDLSKNIYLDGGKPFEVIALTDSPALLSAWGNDTEFANVFAGQARTWLRPGDVLLAISASGNSPNIVKVIEAAHEVGAVTIGFSGCGGGRLAEMAQINLVVHQRNMQQVEDLHMIFGHVVFSALRDRIKGLLAP